ncbi:MAG TPA: tetratricopeptide repeat protein, partial [Bryobacteraceae bacterium]
QQAARDHFKAAVAANPNYQEALLGLGQTELALNNSNAAIQPLERAVRLAPDSVQAHFVLGAALRRAGRTSDALHQQQLAEKIQADQRAREAEKLGSVRK